MYLSLQGNVGLGKAIEYFTSHKITVSIPLNDTQKYDLVIDIEGNLKKISVKTSRNKTKNGTYEVGLRNTGGASGKCIIRHFDKKSCDYVFVLTGNNEMYLIPSEEIEGSSTITVGKKYSKYKIESKLFSDFNN